MTITPKRKTQMPEFTDTFIRAGLDKGWLVPPRDYQHRDPGMELLTWVIWAAIFALAMALVMIVFW